MSPGASDPATRLAALRHRLGGLAYGGDYNPEQWSPDVWGEDVELMREAGVNLVTVGVFAWVSLEPRPGRFEFEWMDDVLDLLHANGIAVDLATPTMAPPAWLVEASPEMLPVMADGETFGFGNRLHFDPASPAYRQAAVRIATALAERYAAHPAVAMWHVSNEYGPAAYNEATSAAFRIWLQKRYRSLDALNEAWYTRFWSQTYTNWEQVRLPETPRTWCNPSRILDARRFHSDLLLSLFQAERDAIRSIDPDALIVTNFMRFYPSADYFEWAGEIDAAALDIYPDPGDPDAHVSAALNFDLMRGLRRGPWLLMEQASSAVSQWAVNHAKPPGAMRKGSVHAVAHGADSVLFFQWRASRGGHERFHSAMLPHSGTRSRTWGEIVALGRDLEKLGEVAGAEIRSEVALLFDWAVRWALEDLHGLPRNDQDYCSRVTDYYRSLHTQHFQVDVVSMRSDLDGYLDGYKVLVIPNAVLVTDGFIRRVEEFVDGGGVVACGFFSGVLDEHAHVRQPAYPGGFRRLIGAYIDEYLPPVPWNTPAVRWPSGYSVAVDYWHERMEPETAEVVATFTGGEADGGAAIVRNELGKGVVHYVAAQLPPPDLDRWLHEILVDAGVRPIVTAPAEISATVRSSDGHDYLFLINHGMETESVAVPAPALDLLSATSHEGEITLGPLEVKVLKAAAPE
jgi:beta-galactosidase